VNIRQGRLSDAKHLYYSAQNKIRESAIDSFNEICSRIEFELAIIEKRWGDSIGVCDSIIEAFKYGGFHWDWARRLIDLGDALIGRDEPGDREQARVSYQQSLDMFTEMGAPGYIKVLEERLKDI
jgi:hypothetical protein